MTGCMESNTRNCKNEPGNKPTKARMTSGDGASTQSLQSRAFSLKTVHFRAVGWQADSQLARSFPALTSHIPKSPETSVPSTRHPQDCGRCSCTGEALRGQDLTRALGGQGLAFVLRPPLHTEWLTRDERLFFFL